MAEKLRLREEEEDDFNMFKEEDAESEDSISSDEVSDTGELREDDEEEDEGDSAEDTGASSNNLRFYPYTNHKLTRSVGTLNLSLSSNVSLATPHHKKLGDIREEDPNERNVNEYINRWSPFNDCSPSTPVTLKRTASKSELSPFVNDPEILRKWRYKVSDLKLTKSSSPSQTENNNAPPEMPNPAAFNAPTGLVSKMTKSLFVYPQRLSIPDTPVKKSPLLENSRLSNTMEDSPRHNITQETTLFQQSPSLKTVPHVAVEDSPLSAANFQNNSIDERTSKVRYPPQFHVNRYKKIKKSRNSVVLKNSELTNSLQEFTDDLYGTDTGYPEQTGDVHFLSNLPAPPSVGTCFFDENSSSADTTPTRRKSLLGAHTRRQQQPPQQPPHPPSPNRLRNPGGQGSAGSTESSPLQNRKHFMLNPDSHLFEKFNNVSTLGDGQFSKVYQVTFAQTNQRYAVKAIQPNKHNCVKRILQEIKLLDEINQTTLDQEGKEYVIDFISSWKYQNSFYVMTEYYENGNLDGFLQEHIIAKNTRLEDWRIWKIIVELSLALRFIHDSCHIVHLDLKPANVMVTFEGNLKLGDFGMATHLPLEDLAFENEGDREYIAPEIISDCIYDFKADIFSLGLMIVEIAANVVLPDNGNAWHKLRSGDLSDAGKLSSTDIHSESLFSNSSKVDTNITSISDYENGGKSSGLRSNIPPWVPKFLIDGESLERMVKWMIDPSYRRRPSADDILHTEECIYVEMTRKAGAIIQEDDYGPKPDFFVT
ncbi:ZYBA0S03-03378g1_1 [Zygosaccharomyces bailii CLIB 213]|uniref:ZYBA0S03-03378g1_1 n=1 Tax=Zygosaccharomyces bailii (strain CLIB 213 / ATCC 58445 / CBS 680 / BCRC 21525 / NBRC 1098 / NCYC 1416 / NRRL Y-2227) TaxID=1333698 RepID=A0A8J2X7T4_ZYGB2|nr:ZYBA0S03-03378g1_1 [Zygosaccharomyces bailii CLIB 213]